MNKGFESTSGIDSNTLFEYAKVFINKLGKIFFSSDSRFEGSLNLNELPIICENVDAHGVAKGNEIFMLFSLLLEGVDSSKNFCSAPLSVSKENASLLGPAYGTSGGTVYKSGPFIICSKPGGSIKNDGIYTVLINPLYLPEIYQNGECDNLRDMINELIEYFQNNFPGIDFISYIDAKDYYECIEELIVLREMSEEDYINFIPIQYKGLNSEALEMIRNSTIYRNFWKNKIEEMKKQGALRMLRKEENNRNFENSVFKNKSEAEELKNDL